MKLKIYWQKLSILLMLTMLILMLSAEKVDALMLELSIEELTAKADSVIVGTVQSVASQWNDDQSAIYTTVTIATENVLKGTTVQDKITVIVPGGSIDGITQFVSETPAFVNGEEVLLFLENQPRTIIARHRFQLKQYGIYGNFQGKKKIIDDTVEGYLVNEIEEIILNLVKEGNYYNTTDSKDEEQILTSNYHYTPLGIKWPGSFPLIEFVVSATEERNNHIQTAANTWSSAGANFSFHYSGTHSRNGTASLNQQNEIMWADLGTNSALALATIWFSGNTIIEADMVMNTRFGWTTNPDSYHDVQTAALHEFGHWIGLDHSPVYESIMYYQYKGTQRTLAQDDIAGIRYIYGTTADVVVPDNDFFASSITFSGNSGLVTGSNVNATREAGEPLHADLPGGASVWWEWTASESGEVCFDTFGSDFDTILAVYSGQSLSGLTPIAANDDYGNTNQSMVTFIVTAENSYKLAVDGWNGAQGSIVLNWQFSPIPAEDTEESGEADEQTDTENNSQEGDEETTSDEEPDQQDNSEDGDESEESNEEESSVDDPDTNDGTPENDLNTDKSEPEENEEQGDSQDTNQSDPEIIAVPQPPAGPAVGYINNAYLYSTVQTTCPDQSAAQYQFDWGNGILSSWLDENQAAQTWPVAGNYPVRVRLRSSGNTELLSAWSDPLLVSMTNYPTAPAPESNPQPVPSPPIPPPSAPLPMQYTFTISIIGEGTTNPLPGSASYNENAEIEITAKPATGWQFDKWVIAGREVFTTSTRLQITGNTSAFAYFKALEKGDLTGDGNINVTDVAMVARYALGLVTLTDAQVACADINGDGTVDVRDTVMIMRFVLGLIDKLPSDS
jgi:hypothetical protein